LEQLPLLKALGADYKHELLGERLTTTPKTYAYLKIAGFVIVLGFLLFLAWKEACLNL
jgi:hypothetical protein